MKVLTPEMNKAATECTIAKKMLGDLLVKLHNCLQQGKSSQRLSYTKLRVIINRIFDFSKILNCSPSSTNLLLSAELILANSTDKEIILEIISLNKSLADLEYTDVGYLDGMMSKRSMLLRMLPNNCSLKLMPWAYFNEGGTQNV